MEEAIQKLLENKKITFKNNKNENNKEKSIIGVGGFGKVYEVEVKIQNKEKNTKIYAMKEIPIEHKDKKKFDYYNETTNKELSLCLNIKHHHIVRSKHIFQTPEIKENDTYKKTFLLLMDKADYPNLYQFVKALHKKTNNTNEMSLFLYEISNNEKEKGLKDYEWFRRMNESLAKFFVKQILYSIEFLHRNFLIHFDLKLQNILITKGMDLKLCDFSLTTYTNFLDAEDKKLFLKMGTYPYMGPEYFKNERQVPKRVAHKVDIYAVGVLLFGLLFSFKEYNEGHQWNNKNKMPNNKEVEGVIEERLKDIENDSYISEKCKMFFKDTLNKDIAERKNVYELLEMPWMNSIDEELEKCLLVNDDFSKKLVMEFIKHGSLKRHLRKNTMRNSISNNNRKFGKGVFKRRKGFARIKADLYVKNNFE